MKTREDDYSFEAMESRARIAKGKPLTEDELSTIKKQAEKIAQLEKAYEAAKEADKIAAEKAEGTRIYQAMLKEIEGEKSEVSELKLNPFWVGLLTILFLPAALLHQKTKLNPFVAGLFSIVAILILLFLAGHEIFRLLK
jgi:uncharacterized membrane protein